MRLAEPAWLLLLVLVVLPWLRGRSRPRLAWPTLDGFKGVPRGWAGPIRWLPAWLRAAGIACLVVALARPQTVGGRSRIAARAVAIVVALDRSSSMRTEDFPARDGPIARIEVARRTLSEFIKGRPDDLIGLVAFANYPDEASPPTLDHRFLLESVRRVGTARAGDDGTNIGDAIVWALNDLVHATPRKKVLILLSDGRNAPAVPMPTDPTSAARMAQDLGVTLHTIAIGRPGPADGPREPTTGLAIPVESAGPDLDALEQLATIGGGRAFVAADERALGRVFRALDALEKSPIQATITTRYREWYAPWIGAALALLALDRLLVAGRLGRLP